MNKIVAMALYIFPIINHLLPIIYHLFPTFQIRRVIIYNLFTMSKDFGKVEYEPIKLWEGAKWAGLIQLQATSPELAVLDSGQQDRAGSEGKKRASTSCFYHQLSDGKKTYWSHNFIALPSAFHSVAICHLPLGLLL
jgi:hypothetical protein